MNLTIDYGNTMVKVGVFDNDKIIDYRLIIPEKESKIIPAISEKYNIDKVIFSSVINGKNPRQYFDKDTSVTSIEEFDKVPFLNKYKTPRTLGQDRIALVCGGLLIYPNQDLLIIDIGTCITYDFINKEKEYLGGSISLGLKMRFKALHQYTEKLPLVDFQDNDKLIGTTTQECINSGVIQGMKSEIKGIISLYKKQYPNLKIILTGGDIIFLVKKLKKVIFVEPHLSLKGMNYLIKINNI